MTLAIALLLWFIPQAARPVDPHLKQGLTALQAGDMARARQELEEAESTDPSNPYVWTSLAQLYLRLGEQEKAEAAAAKAAQIAPKDPVIGHALGIFYFEYAQFLLRKEEFTKAADVLTGALQVAPNNPQLVLALGVARYGQRRFTEAIDAFLQVIRMDSSIEQPYMFLGKMLDQAAPRLDEIIKDDRDWLVRAPKDARPSLELAKALLAANPRSAEAATLLEQSVALDSGNWEAHYEFGVLLANRHQYQQAATQLERSIELNGREPMPHYHLARVYDRLGEPEHAEAERKIHQQLTEAAPPRNKSENAASPQ